jgi:hypothetical protein
MKKMETIFKSVYPSFQKYVRKNKISKIFGLEYKSIIITSSAKGLKAISLN